MPGKVRGAEKRDMGKSQENAPLTVFGPDESESRRGRRYALYMLYAQRIVKRSMPCEAAWLV